MGFIITYFSVCLINFVNRPHYLGPITVLSVYLVFIRFKFLVPLLLTSVFSLRIFRVHCQNVLNFVNFTFTLKFSNKKSCLYIKIGDLTFVY